jgi:PAS domain S-box-containing protein
MLNGFALHEVICDERGNPINFRYLEVNPAFEKIIQRDAEQIVGKTVLEVLPNLENFWIETFGQVALRGRPIHIQRFSAELERYFDVLAFSPAKMQFAIVITDITDQKRAENVISHNEEMFRCTFEQSPVGAAMVGLDWRFQKVNQELCRLTGYSASELVGLRFLDIFHDEDPGFDSRYIQEVCNGKNNRYRVDKRCVRKDSTTTWIRLSVSLVRDRHQEPLYYLPMLEDINDRKRLEEEKNTLLQLLDIVNGESDLDKMLESILAFLKSWAEIDAIAVRLKQGEDFPYFKTNGFPQEFVHREWSLQSLYNKGAITACRGNGQPPPLDCMCGYVIRESLDNPESLFTDKGSFYTNSTTLFLRQYTEDETPVKLRKHCNVAGYESVLLVPLRAGGVTVGLLQLNDKTTDKFSYEFVTTVERLADYISVAVAQRLVEEQLMAKQIELEEMNSALKVLLKTRENDVLEYEQEILANIKQLVLPSIDNIKAGNLSVQQKAHLNILQSNLENISSPFAKKLVSAPVLLSPVLLQIAEFIKSGRSSKEIAELQGISVKTVETYRKRIRERLNLHNTKVNLRTYLMNIT